MQTGLRSPSGEYLKPKILKTTEHVGVRRERRRDGDDTCHAFALQESHVSEVQNQDSL